jgi:hypothetical protein
MWGWAASLTGAVVLLGGLVPSATPAATAVPDVTIIGDSVMTGVLWHADAVAIVQKDLQVNWDVAVCRTLTGISCPFEGARPATLVQVVDTDGVGLGKTVVVECGYNDPESSFAADVDQSIGTLLGAGVEKILWVNLHEATPELAAMNRVLVAAAAQHPQVTLLDWNSYSQGHNDWFQTDLIHLTAGGGVGLATLIHAAVWTALAPPLVAVLQPLPPAQVGRPYSALVRVAGGRPPYIWRAVSGPLPWGLHLRPDGRIDGTPRKAGRVEVTLRASDSDNVTTFERQQIRVSPAAS